MGVLLSRRAAVLGAGSWGTALAAVLASNGFRVSLWSRSERQVQVMRGKRRNPKYLPDVVLDEAIHPTTVLREATEGAELVLFATPSHAMREVASLASRHLNRGQLVIHAAKGFELKTLKRMSQVICEELPTHTEKDIVVLSGPSHAEEVAQQLPTAVVVASEDKTLAEQAQDCLINAYFRVYTNPDVIGVEIGGALKNVIALAGGISDGLGFGDNAKAALLTRGLAEIVRLGIAMGAHPSTFSGLAGIGDLVVTCTSQHSRNWRAGFMLGRGQSLDTVLNEMGMVVEGVKTTRAAYELSQTYAVEMPITCELYHVLFSGKDARRAVGDLMGRGKTHEIEDVVKNL